MGKKAVLAGASGLVGGHLLDILLHDPVYDEVSLLVRKKMDIHHPKLSQLRIDFDRMSDDESSITGDVIFCSLGTTRKKTPDKDMYYRIEHDYPLRLAKIAAKNRVPQFHVISAIGASPKSANFYSRNKGEMTRDISALDFQRLCVYEPSLLTGERSEHRGGERFFAGLMKLVNPLLVGGWKKYRSVAASEVARAMVGISHRSEPGKFIIRFGYSEPLIVPLWTRKQ